MAELERWNADLAEKIRRMERQVEAGHKLLATLADRPVYRMGGES